MLRRGRVASPKAALGLPKHRHIPTGRAAAPSISQHFSQAPAPFVSFKGDKGRARNGLVDPLRDFHWYFRHASTND